MTREEAINIQIESFINNSDIINLEIQEWNNLIFISYNKTVGKLSKDKDLLYPHLVVFHKKKKKPISSFYYLSFENRDREIQKIKDQELLNIKRVDMYLKQCKVENDKIQVGTILYSSWGYEQTNIDFYIVLERNNNIVLVQQIEKYITKYNSNDSGKCVANPKFMIGEPFKKRLTKFGGIKLTSYSNASIWNGNELYFSSYY